MKKRTTILYKTFLICLIIMVGFLFVPLSQKVSAQTSAPATSWKYQCIDTMKVSRDNARGWAGRPDLSQHIAWEMQTIKSLGANCVAIATPYDTEFLPYLSAWVAGARAENLHIWFRGNFAGWEGWFEYPKITSTDTFLKNLDLFIVSNPQLFQDGDIFTGAPEAENGGPFGGSFPHAETYHTFLVDQYRTEQKAFEKIGKKVELNWFSMNGDVAKLYDQNTLDTIGNLATVDHYINNAAKMDDIITHFKDGYASNVMIGEFGAPIPDINGPMNEDEQAAFVDSVFKRLYDRRDSVIGVNYWVLTDGSTAIMNDDQSPRKVTEVIKRYFMPAMITGKVTDSQGEPLANVAVTTTDASISAMTDNTGLYSLPLATSSVTMLFTYDNQNATASAADLKPGETFTKDIVFTEINLSLLQKFGKFMDKIF